jgi:hypothetical protein
LSTIFTCAFTRRRSAELRRAGESIARATSEIFPRRQILE